jgi:hypothetical protein
MNAGIRLTFGGLVLICLLAAITDFATAAKPPAKPAVPAAAPPKQAPAQPQDLIKTLQQAHQTLMQADHDYHGKRDEATKEIADAVTLLGGDATAGDGKAKPQPLSDLQIRSVQMSLLGVGRSAPDGSAQKDLVGHMNNAIQHLSDGLLLETDPNAANKPGIGKAPTENAAVIDAVGTNIVEITSLERIYEILKFGNHDYNGHRVSAMKAIAKAVKTLGGAISGDGKVKENQTISDDQLRQAEFLLEQVRNSFADDQKKVNADLNSAVKELTAALAVK